MSPRTSRPDPHHDARPPRKRVARAIRVAVALTAMFLAGAGTPAAAHTDLLAASPAPDDTVSRGVDELSLSFAQEVVPGSAAVQVLGPGGEDVVDDAVVVEGAVLRLPLHLDLVGDHTVSYRVVAADMHVVVGEFTFEVASAVPGASERSRPAPAPATPAPATPAAGSRGTSSTLLVAGLAVTLVAVSLLHVRRRRRRLRDARPRRWTATAQDGP